MRGVLVDSSVLLDVITDDRRWASWSESQLDHLSDEATLYMNDIIYAEISVGFLRIEELESFVSSAQLRILPIPREALFLAGKAFMRYRQRQSVKESPLPDFFIGAHAAVARLPLLSRDPRRIMRYFPTVRLISL